MTDSFQKKKIKHKGSLGSGKFHLTSKCPVLPPTGPSRPRSLGRQRPPVMLEDRLGL